MRAVACLFLGILGAESYAAEKIPLDIFLSDIRNQLHAIGQPDEQDPRRAVIRNIHLELNVIIEKDARGRPRYYVLDGIMDDGDVVTQKIAFDMELHQDSSARTVPQENRAYSTRRRNHRPGGDGYFPAGPYPPYPGYYLPEIYPVIQFDTDH